MIKHVVALLLLAVPAGIFALLLGGYSPDVSLNQTALYYANHTASDLGAANIVTAIVVTYRGLDTLGEVTVLFLSAAILGLVLAAEHHHEVNGQKRIPAGELLTTGTRYLAPLTMLLGIYVFVNGHLTPGGGFQGGAIIASGVLLLLLADPLKRFSHGLIARIESTAGVLYVALGLLGIFLAGGFLDNRILPIGEVGELVSAGAIPLIYSLIGLKVGAEFASMLASLSEAGEL